MLVWLWVPIALPPFLLLLLAALAHLERVALGDGRGGDEPTTVSPPAGRQADTEPRLWSVAPEVSMGRDGMVDAPSPG